VRELLEQEIRVHEGKIYIGNLKITPDLQLEIKTAQEGDDVFQEFK
jgi:hypothetical protein